MSGIPLLLVGCGGFARETACAVHAVNSVAPTFRLLGFLDDAPHRQGTVVDGLPVLGPVEAALAHPEARLVVCTGSPPGSSISTEPWSPPARRPVPG
ncbi:MAG TPA: hypothetical protein VKP64_11620 [Mycobacteriales bacterium]|nr:hypothetical protein [Mycobacteriales bacterium]